MPYFPSQKGVIQSRLPPENPRLNQYWIEISSGGLFLNEWFWNGTYWLSSEVFAGIYHQSLVISVTGVIAHIVFEDFGHNVWLLSNRVKMVLGTTNDSLNYWSFVFRRSNGTTHTTIPSTQISTITSAPNSHVRLVSNINSHVDVTDLKVVFFRSEAVKVGNPSNVTCWPSFDYRLARKSIV